LVLYKGRYHLGERECYLRRILCRICIPRAT